MSQNDSQPEDGDPFACEDVDVNELAEIEQRLKMARPRPAELDIDTIVRRACADNRALVPADARVNQRATRWRGWLGTIAGAWACGALAGALAMYVLMGRPSVTETPSNSSLVRNTDQPNPSARNDSRPTDDDASPTRRQASQPTGTPPWSPAESLVSTRLLDPFLGSTASFDDGRSTLSAGALVQDVTGAVSPRFRHTTGTTPRRWSVVPDSDDDLPDATAPDPDSASPMTRAQLLRELLGENRVNPIL